MKIEVVRAGEAPLPSLEEINEEHVETRDGIVGVLCAVRSEKLGEAEPPGRQGPVVGNQEPLDIAQGRYGSAHAAVGWETRHVRLTATGEKLFNVVGDRFAGGNPFALASRDEYTPLRPRTVRVAASVSW